MRKSSFAILIFIFSLTVFIVSCEKDEEKIIGVLKCEGVDVRNDTLRLYFQAYNDINNGENVENVDVKMVNIVLDEGIKISSEKVGVSTNFMYCGCREAVFPIAELECDKSHNIIKVRAIAKNNSQVVKDVSKLGFVIEKLGVLKTVVSNLTTTKCTVKSNVTKINRKRLVAAGFCYSSINKKPTIEDSVLKVKQQEVLVPEWGDADVKDGANQDSSAKANETLIVAPLDFSAEIEGLKPATVYYVRAFVMSESGICYYGDVTELETNELSVKTSYVYKYLGEKIVGVELVGSVFDIDSKYIESYGFCYSQMAKEPTKDDAFIETKGSVYEFRDDLKQLSHDVRYYVRAYITTKYGTYYGDVQTIRIDKSFVCTYTNLVKKTATSINKCRGTVDVDNSNIKKYGFCYSAINSNPTKEDAFVEKEGAVSEFTENLTELMPGQKYFIRAYVITEYGIHYGNVDYVWTENISVKTDCNYLHSEATSIKCSGAVSNIESSYIETYGFCYSTLNSTPTKEDLFIEKESAVSEFTEEITDLIPGQKYFIRAYVTTKYGIHYGDVQREWTENVSVETTVSYSHSEATSIKCSGAVSNIKSSYIETCGFCYSTSNSTPTKEDAFVEKKEMATDFSEEITDLTPGQKYFIRAYVITKHGIHYGDVQSRWTGNVDVKTGSLVVENIVVKCKGSVSDIKSSYIETYGFCYSTSNSTPTKEDAFVEKDGSVTEFSGEITDLIPGQKYFIRAYVITKYGVHYGDVQYVYSKNILVNTVCSSTENAAIICSGSVANIKSSCIESYGFCYSATNLTPTKEDVFVEMQGSDLEFNEEILGLSSGTKYHVRAYVVTKYGVFYGNVITIKVIS